MCFWEALVKNTVVSPSPLHPRFLEILGPIAATFAEAQDNVFTAT